MRPNPRFGSKDLFGSKDYETDADGNKKLRRFNSQDLVSVAQAASSQLKRTTSKDSVKNVRMQRSLSQDMWTSQDMVCRLCTSLLRADNIVVSTICP
jgi:hypothetical protein